MLRWILLTLVAAGLASPVARAHPVSGGVDGILWPFEGQGSAPGGADVPVSGTLLFPSYDPHQIVIDIAVDGVADAITGFDVNLGVTDGAPGSLDSAGNGNYVFSQVNAPAFLHAIESSEFESWSEGHFVLKLFDPDGTAWSNLAGNPSSLVVPVYAPHAALFEVRRIDVFQIHCVSEGAHEFCPNGAPTFEVSAFAITIDRFVDPVPEPASFALSLLAASLLLGASKPYPEATTASDASNSGAPRPAWKAARNIFPHV